jgi:hypothetical protein
MQVGIIHGRTAREVAAADGVPEEDIALADPRVEAAVVAGYHLHDFSEADWKATLEKREACMVCAELNRVAPQPLATGGVRTHVTAAKVGNSGALSAARACGGRHR